MYVSGIYVCGCFCGGIFMCVFGVYVVCVYMCECMYVVCVHVCVEVCVCVYVCV